MQAPSEFLRSVNANNRAMLYRCRHDSATAGDVVPRLANLLDHGIPQVVSEALRALHCIGTAAFPAADAVAEHVRNPDVIVRQNAVSTLGHICLEHPEVAIPHLVSASDQPDVLKFVLFALVNFGRRSASALPTIIRSYDNRDASIRRLAIRALLASESTEPPAVAVLSRAMSDNNGEVRKAASRWCPEPSLP